MIFHNFRHKGSKSLQEANHRFQNNETEKRRMEWWAKHKVRGRFKKYIYEVNWKKKTRPLISFCLTHLEEFLELARPLRNQEQSTSLTTVWHHMHHKAQANYNYNVRCKQQIQQGVNKLKTDYLFGLRILAEVCRCRTRVLRYFIRFTVNKAFKNHYKLRALFAQYLMRSFF